ncbi:multicopper oxidase family protein [Anaeromyxobacter oryzae]|uniref:Plastocyanin-like domain-containing protein n=1 Tax=Anaeromyxobacter oryzae TaxID=2918170 RepID=A0ABM7WSN9_9BACT|nr:multicopper oxidase domain-containing protein [Anaeromyxobacter oryzae]BDG02487.1 hypothetical protein AMOR_14830 [Anaeromyxobacter oryzae]
MNRVRGAQALAWMGACVLLASGSARAQTTYNPLLLPGGNIPQFAQPLPVLDVWKAKQPAATYGSYPVIPTVDGTAPVTLTMCEFQSNVLPPLAAGAAGTPTSVWGYVSGSACPGKTAVRDTYIGPVIVASRGTPTAVTYVNALGSTSDTGVNAYRFSTDQTLHWADPLNLGRNDCMMKVEMGGPLLWNGQPDPCALNYSGPIATVPHLHGAEDPAAIDGSPDSWFTSDGRLVGSKFYTKGWAGTVSGLPATPGTAPYAAGAIVYDLATKAAYQVQQDPTTLAFSWTPYMANRVTYTYPNSQEASPIWFHDHTLGATRLNVYAGLAGAYYVVDPAQQPLPGADVTDVVPLVIQDRMFDTGGQLFFPADSYTGLLWTPNPDHPYWVPEFLGDTVVVNGKAWPYLDLQPRRYRFLVLNGSNARTYELSLIDPVTKTFGPPMYVISNDGGYLDRPAKIDPAAGQVLTVMPGERYEIIVDFAGFGGRNFTLRNTARTPYPKGSPPPGSTLGRVMQFRVGATAVADASYDPAAGGALRTPMVRLASAGALAQGVTPTVARELTLNEVMGMKVTWPNPITGVATAYPGGPLEILVNNTKWSGVDPRTMAVRTDFTRLPTDPAGLSYSELPREGETEIWEIVNLTADAHPMHLHLVQFQILNRQSFATNQYLTAYNALFPGGVFQGGYGPPLDYAKFAPRLNPPYVHGFGGTLVPVVGGNPDVFPYLQGPALAPGPQETGWKDTVMAPPGMVTRLVVRWAPTSVAAGTPAASATFPFDPSSGGRYNYVWHCHIIDHEDNEMMRPDVVISDPATPRTFAMGASF